MKKINDKKPYFPNFHGLEESELSRIIYSLKYLSQYTQIFTLKIIITSFRGVKGVKL